MVTSDIVLYFRIIIYTLNSPAKFFNLIFHRLHRFKRVKITHICLIWEQPFTIHTDWTSIYITKTVYLT